MPVPLPALVPALLPSPAGRPARRAAPSGRRRSARRAVVTGLLAFALLTAALVAAAETVKPEWRDPEYGHRLRQVRGWQAKRPDRPLVLVVGSSRAQMGVSPHAMGFPDEPGQPLVYNFGYRGAHPLGVWLMVQRALDNGVKPRVVLVQLAAIETKIDGLAEEQFPKWGSRLSGADVRRFAPYTTDPGVFREGIRAARRDPWNSRREALMSDLLREWQTTEMRWAHVSWEWMDLYGFGPYPFESVPDEERRAGEQTVSHHARALDTYPTSPTCDRVLRDLIARCRRDGITVAVFWIPESPNYRKMYTPAALAHVEAYNRTLTTDIGVPIFPAPDHMLGTDFADGYHLLPAGAAKYSRWLAEAHLKPWLAEALK